MSSTSGTVAVMGAGAWGTAVAKVLADGGNEVRLWARRQQVAEEINAARTNTVYLPGVFLPAEIRATADPAEALAGVRTVFLGVPSQTMRANLENWRTDIDGGATLVSLAKGIELGSCLRMSQVIAAVTGVDPAQVAVVSGPNLAAEIAAEQPAATVVACTDSGRAVALQRALDTGYLRPYTNTDVAGTEIGGPVRTSSRWPVEWRPESALVRTRPRLSSPAASPKSSGWDLRWAPTSPPWPGWPVSAT